jgi:hypothetical protein
MPRKQGQDGSRTRGRSPSQLEWTSAVGRASNAWEYLTDDQRQVWRTEASTMRTTGQRLFVKINARRLRDRLELLTAPPVSKPYSPGPILKEFVITNRGGQIRLKVRVDLAPGARFSVWGSRPCNLGVSGCDKCPWLGPLPAPVRGWCDITDLYFKKHGEYISRTWMRLVGKRIVIRVREELDTGVKVFEQARAVVPPPQSRPQHPKKP